MKLDSFMIEINFEEYFDSVLVSGKLGFEKKKEKKKENTQ